MHNIFLKHVRFPLSIIQLVIMAVLLVINVKILAADVELALLPKLQEVPVISADGPVIRVDAGGDLQAALNLAVPGSVIELVVGAVYRGPFVLPYKDGDGWITIRTDITPENHQYVLPAAGVRVTPDDSKAMARLDSDSHAVLIAGPGAHHYRFIGIEFSPSVASTPGEGVFLDALVVLGLDIENIEDIPHHFIFERCYLHGDPIIGARRGFILNSASTMVLDSWLSDFKTVGTDSQAIIGWAGSGPYSIINNYLEAAGENVMFGGGDPLIENLVPSDIEIRGNHFSKPLAWMRENINYTGTNWSIKNLLELKNSRRVIIDGNLFENNWVESQNGYAVLFTVRNQEGTAPWSVVEDITFSNNIVRHVANGINILGIDDIHTSQQTRRIVINNNLFLDLGNEWGEGNLFQMLDGVESLSIEYNTALNSGNILKSDGRPTQHFTFRNNVVKHNEYGIIGTGTGVGNPSIDRYFKEANIQDNVIIGGTRSRYPAGNIFPRTVDNTGFIDVKNGDYRMVSRSSQGAGFDASALCTALSPIHKPQFCSSEHVQSVVKIQP